MRKLLLDKNRKHVKRCRARWCKLINRDIESPDYQDEWYSEQCVNCNYYIRLINFFRDDWGVCSNPESNFDGKVRFKHDGCDKYHESGDC